MQENSNLVDYGWTITVSKGSKNAEGYKYRAVAGRLGINLVEHGETIEEALSKVQDKTLDYMGNLNDSLAKSMRLEVDKESDTVIITGTLAALRQLKTRLARADEKGESSVKLWRRNPARKEWEEYTIKVEVFDRKDTSG